MLAVGWGDATVDVVAEAVALVEAVEELWPTMTVSFLVVTVALDDGPLGVHVRELPARPLDVNADTSLAAVTSVPEDEADDCEYTRVDSRARGNRSAKKTMRKR